MDQKEELLIITMEECAEAAVECAKVIRFAADDSNFSPTLERELGDLLCMVDLLKEANIVTDAGLNEAKAAKREKLKKWSNLNV
jgi:AMMECR1 domain-containing protein